MTWVMSMIHSYVKMSQKNIISNINAFVYAWFFFVKGSTSEHTSIENVWENISKQWLPLGMEIGNFFFSLHRILYDLHFPPKKRFCNLMC